MAAIIIMKITCKDSLSIVSAIHARISFIEFSVFIVTLFSNKCLLNISSMSTPVMEVRDINVSKTEKNSYLHESFLLKMETNDKQNWYEVKCG